MTTGTDQQSRANGVPCVDDLLHKVPAKSGVTGLISIGGFGNILFNLRPEFEPPDHFAKRERSEPFIASNVTADDGSRR